VRTFHQFSRLDSDSFERAVPIMYKDHVGVPCLLRNYVARHEPPTNLTVAEAMLASCATPPLFVPASIGKDYATFGYTGGDLALSNPIREILAEAHRVFEDQATVRCLLSVGCGHPGILRTPNNSDATAAWASFFRQLAMDSEKTAREINVQMSQLTLYHRLSVTSGLEGSQTCSGRCVNAIVALTSSYLNEIEIVDSLSRCAETIKNGDASSTLEQLSRCLQNLC